MAADKSRPPLFRRLELGHRAGFFAADLRRLWQVKCGNQFALPPGLLSRILMNLSLLHTHTHSFKHTFQRFPCTAGNEKAAWMISPGLKAVCVFVDTDYTSVPLDFSKQLQGKQGKSQTWSTAGTAQPLWAKNIQNKNNKCTCASEVRVLRWAYLQRKHICSHTYKHKQRLEFTVGCR